MLNISKNEEITKTLKIYFEDIEKIQSFGNYLVLQIAGQSYIIKKDALISESAFITFCNNTPNKVEAKKPKDKLKIISILLFVLSICTIWGALIGVAILSGINQAMTENMWVFFLFLPLLQKKDCFFGVHRKSSLSSIFRSGQRRWHGRHPPRLSPPPGPLWGRRAWA